MTTDTNASSTDTPTTRTPTTHAGPSTARNPNAIDPADLVMILAKLSGRPITPAMLDADLAAGAPRNPDGTIHLIHFGAWLLREQRRPVEDRVYGR